MDPHSPVITGHAIPQNEFQKPITETIRLTANYRIHTYHLPECGTVTHFLANSVINSAPGGPDEMFLAMQREKIGLKRFPLKLSLLTGHNLTQHFAVNYGMPYKYVVEVASKPFSEAPNVLVQALHRIIWAGEKSVNDGSFDDAKFNEMLTVGYFEGQKMDYHDDGEADLGPTIATLSLGCPASMTLRMKYAPHFGVSKQGNPYNDPPLPGCADYENRRRHHSLSAGRPSSPDNRRGGLLPTDPNLHTPRKGNPPVLLSLQLNHGDMVCMHGAGIQKYYEHAVTPAGKLRFSLTCRHIRPSAVPTDEHSKGVLPHSNAYGYCGEELVVSQ
ncbi:MAG: hypothetical protein M1817_000805 [Caeruleum heppii]|nr:MAG: hypothetical protein M1817_000805 [Caeruleum heppii]